MVCWVEPAKPLSSTAVFIAVTMAVLQQTGYSTLVYQPRLALDSLRIADSRRVETGACRRANARDWRWARLPNGTYGTNERSTHKSHESHKSHP
jgi:hypothetical protein